MSETALTRFRPTHATAYVAALAVVLAVAVIALPSLYYPFGRDQGIHAYIAKLAGDGYVVYRDVFNVKPPLTTVVHGLAQALFGETMRAIRLMDLLIVAATALMLQSLVARYLKSLWLGGVAAVAFATGHYSNSYWSTAQTDGWTCLFVAAAMLLYSRSLDARSAQVRMLILCAAGVMIGFAFWLKYTIVVTLLVFPAVHLAERLHWRRILADGAAVSAGFLACVLLGIATLTAIGALPAFLDIQDFMRSYVAHGRAWREFALAPLLMLVRAPFATALAMLGFYAVYRTLSRPGRHRPEAVALLVWTAAAWGAALLQGKVFVYHLLPLNLPLAIAAAVGVHALTGVLARLGGRRTAALAAATACALIVWLSNIPSHYRALGTALGGNEQALRAYWDGGRFSHSDFDTRDNLALVDYLKQRTLPCDSLYVWGYEPAVYFLSGRRMVSRFLYNFPMFTAYYRQSYRDEFMAALAADTPAVFVVEHEDRTPHVSVHDHDSAEIMAQFGALKSFLGERYRLRDRVARFDVYYRSDIDPAAARRCPAAAQR